MLEGISAILLAAGESARMKSCESKLLLPLEGRELVTYPAEAAREAGLQDFIVVLGRDAEKVEKAVKKYRPRYVFNRHYALGQGSSIVCGMKALGAESRACFFLMGDQPGLRAAQLRQLAEAADPGKIVVPLYAGRRGSPCLFGSDFYEELLQLRADESGRKVILAHPEAIRELAMGDDVNPMDIDTKEDYREACSKAKEACSKVKADDARSRGDEENR